jgi:FtsZ-binding cell division protein ZapB
MADDLEKQVEEIEAENSKVKTTVVERTTVLQEQIGELGELSNLRDKKGDQDRELEMLNKEVEDLKIQNTRYENDIEALRVEREELTE